MKRLAQLIFAFLCLLVCVVFVQFSAHLSEPAGRERLGDPLGRTFLSPPPGLVESTMGLGLLLLGAWLTGRIFRRLHLPMITGYLAFGVVVGPELHAFIGAGWPEILTRDELSYLRLIDNLAIALIALTAGGEIRIELLRRALKPVAWITGAGVGFSLLMISGVLLLMRPLIPLLEDVPISAAIVICLVLGSVGIANSPATVIAMIKEMRASGPMTQISLAVTVCKDLCLIICFAVLMSISVTALAATDGHSAGVGEALGNLAWHLLGSIGIGALVGAAMTLAVKRVGNRLAVFTLAVGLGIAFISDALMLEPLLVALSAGFVMANLWPEKSQRLFHTIEELSLPVYCVFFAVAGAGINLEAVSVMWPLALMVFVLRTTAIWIGTWIGATKGGLTGGARDWMWTSFIAQAGVTVALASVVRDSFPGEQWADDLSSLILAVVALHQIAGPILMRIGLLRAGEVPTFDPNQR